MIILIIDHPSIFRHIRNIFISTLVSFNLVEYLLVDTGSVEIYLLSAKGAIGLSFLEGKQALLADRMLLGTNQVRYVSGLVVLFRTISAR